MLTLFSIKSKVSKWVVDASEYMNQDHMVSTETLVASASAVETLMVLVEVNLVVLVAETPVALAVADLVALAAETQVVLAAEIPVVLAAEAPVALAVATLVALFSKSNQRDVASVDPLLAQLY